MLSLLLNVVICVNQRSISPGKNTRENCYLTQVGEIFLAKRVAGRECLNVFISVGVNEQFIVERVTQRLFPFSAWPRRRECVIHERRFEEENWK